MLFALDGQQARAERLGEADAALVRGSRIAGGRHDQGFRESFDVLSVGVSEGGFHTPMLTEVAGVDGSASVQKRCDLENVARHRALLLGRVAFLVEAVNGHQGLVAIAVATVGIALAAEVAQEQQGFTTASGLKFGDALDHCTPAQIVIKPTDHAPNCGGVSDLASVCGDDRFINQWPHDLLEGGGSLLGIGAERTSRGFSAQGRHVVEGTLETRELDEATLGGADGGVDRGVEHHGPHVLREGFGVDRAEPGTVAGAEKGELVIAEHRAEYVHVAGDIARADVSQHVFTAGTLGAFLVQLTGLVVGVVLAPGVDRVDQQVGLSFGIGEAV